MMYETCLKKKKLKLYLESALPVIVIDPSENYNKQKEIQVFHKSCIYITVF